jgi:hypothetical protein
MTWLRRNIFKALMGLSLFILPGADIECEDGELEIDWPDFDRDDDWDWDGPPPAPEPGPWW